MIKVCGHSLYRLNRNCPEQNARENQDRAGENDRHDAGEVHFQRDVCASAGHFASDDLLRHLNRNASLSLREDHGESRDDREEHEEDQ